jgi:hypothetical protein
MASKKKQMVTQRNKRHGRAKVKDKDGGGNQKAGASLLHTTSARTVRNVCAKDKKAACAERQPQHRVAAKTFDR